MNWLKRIVGRATAPTQPISPPTITVTLWSKPGCCLCERAEEILQRLAQDYPIRVEHRDITADPDASARFWDRIPVVDIAGGARFEGKITEHRLRREIGRVTDE